MKVIIYNINQDTKKSLALLNRKKHKITTITDPLSDHTVRFANDKDAVICDAENFSAPIIGELISFGVKYIILRSIERLVTQSVHSEYDGLKYSKIESADAESEAAQIITILDEWQAESTT